MNEQVRKQSVTLEFPKLLQKVEGLEQELSKSRHMANIGVLAGGIAHDFNNILTAVIGWTEIIKREVEPDHSIQEKLDHILQAGERAKDLVYQILSSSRLSSGGIDIISFPKVVRETVSLLHSIIPRSIKITTSIPKEGGFIKADPIRMHQLVMNIVTNAYQSIDEESGEITIQVTCQDSKSDINDNNHKTISEPVILCIKDTGRGIPEAELTTVFEHFFTTKGSVNGTGLGLSTVKEIVEEFGGKINVQSKVNVGSTFTVVFPQIHPDVERHSLSQVNENIFSQISGNILVVDDEEHVTNVLKTVLVRAGYTVRSSNSSLSALEMFLNQPDFFNVVITDQTMPEMNGDQLARKMLNKRPDLPIILCTGYSSQINEEQAVKLGISSFLLKPVTKASLLKAISAALEELSIIE